MTIAVNTKTHTDIKKFAWIERYIPAFFIPYIYLMRLDRPIGIWLLLLPALWSITLASNTIPVILYTGGLFFIGAILMRSAGCIMNDIWDRDLDKQVERTKNRPIASGAISIKHALAFLATLLLFGLSILLQFNNTTIILGCISIPMIALYPLMKRITWWPQAFLGLTFNFGALMGWSAITDKISITALLLYCGGIFWTIGYDTIYAHQDKEDDALIGIKSTALKFGNHAKAWITGFYALSLLCFVLAMATIHGTNPFLCVFILPALHMIWQIQTWKTDNPTSALRIFKSNFVFGLLVLLCLAV